MEEKCELQNATCMPNDYHYRHRTYSLNIHYCCDSFTYLQKQNKLWKSLHGLNHEAKKWEAIVCWNLLYIQEISKGWFSFCFDFREVHGIGEVVDEATVDVEHVSLAVSTLSLCNKGNEDITDFFISIPIAYAVAERYSEEKMTL